MLLAPAQLAKKLATGSIPPAVHRRRDLRCEAAGFVFEPTRSLAPEKPELPQVRDLHHASQVPQSLAGAVLSRNAVVTRLPPDAVHGCWWRQTWHDARSAAP